MNWYCLHTRPQHEAHAAAHLRETLGVETYFPLLRRYQTIRRVRRLVTRPLFPRYLFCRFDLARAYAAVRYSRDVIDVVRFGASPAIVGDALIEELKSWAGEAVDLITLQPELQPGDTVEISDGPMRGLQAVILRQKDDRDRVAVLLSILEQKVQLVISRTQLTPLTGSGRL